MAPMFTLQQRKILLRATFAHASEKELFVLKTRSTPRKALTLRVYAKEITFLDLWMLRLGVGCKMTSNRLNPGNLHTHPFAKSIFFVVVQEHYKIERSEKKVSWQKYSTVVVI